MSARDELFRRVAGAFIDEDKANALLDAYCDEVRREAVEDLRRATLLADDCSCLDILRRQIRNGGESRG